MTAKNGMMNHVETDNNAPKRNPKKNMPIQIAFTF